MGFLKDEYFRPDHGNNNYGYSSFEDALTSVEDPCIGDTFKISGRIYELKGVPGKLEFVELEE